MAPDFQRKGKFSIMEYAASKESGNALGESDNKPINCASNYADDFFDMEVSLTEQAENVNIGDPLERIPPTDNSLVKTESDDATENSSSFGNTVSEDENEAMLSDDEVISKSNGDPNSLMHADESSEFLHVRKKKLSAHWKAYIESLKWRCKWVELKISRFRSEALKYDLLLEKNKRRRQFNLKGLKVEDVGAKSLPFPSDIQRIKVMKREKRKRDEDTVDKVEYMERHKLFSYFGSKGYDVASIDADSENLGKKVDVKSVIMSLEFTDDPMEELLWKIGAAQSNVSQQKNRLDKVASENAEKMSSALSAFPPNNGDKLLAVSSNIASPHMPENNTSDLVMTENASHGEVTKLPDVTESTDQQMGNFIKNLGPEHLIDNHVAKEEVDNLHEVQIEPVEVLKEEREEKWSTIPSGPVDENVKTDVQQAQIVQSVSKANAPKKKRRGRWKANKYRRLPG